jgi:hypothetical protein
VFLYIVLRIKCIPLYILLLYYNTQGNTKKICLVEFFCRNKETTNNFFICATEEYKNRNGIGNVCVQVNVYIKRERERDRLVLGFNRIRSFAWK